MIVLVDLMANPTKRIASDILYKIQKYFMTNKRLQPFKVDFLNRNSQPRLIMTLQVSHVVRN